MNGYNLYMRTQKSEPMLTAIRRYDYKLHVKIRWPTNTERLIRQLIFQAYPHSKIYNRFRSQSDEVHSTYLYSNFSNLMSTNCIMIGFYIFVGTTPSPCFCFIKYNLYFIIFCRIRMFKRLWITFPHLPSSFSKVNFWLVCIVQLPWTILLVMWISCDFSVLNCSYYVDNFWLVVDIKGSSVDNFPFLLLA